MFSEALHQRCSPREMLCKIEANLQKNNHAEARPQQSRFATLLKSHPRTDAPAKIRSTPAEHTLPPSLPSPPLSLQDNISGTLLLYVKRVLKDLNYKVIICSC